MLQQSTLKVVGIPTEAAERARTTQRDDFGHDLHPEIIQNTAPCRHCLRIAQPGEKMLLLSYRPFAADFGPYSEIGPIFIHADACERYREERVIPADFDARELVIRAYNHQHAIYDSTIASPGMALQRAAAFLEDPNVAYVHARHTTYTCFDFQIERNDS